MLFIMCKRVNNKTKEANVVNLVHILFFRCSMVAQLWMKKHDAGRGKQLLMFFLFF